MKKSSRGTVIQDLPNELLSRILAANSIRDDLGEVQNVCRLWKAIVDETVGREVIIYTMEINPTIHYPSSTSTISSDLNIISKIGVKSCTLDLSEITPYAEDDTSRPPCLPNFKYPCLLKQVYINGVVNSGIFNILLSGTLNLAVLELNSVALHQLNPPDLERLELPNLKVLGVRRCIKSSFRGFDDNLGLSNLRVLLSKNIFPSLSQLDVRFPVENFADFATTRSLLVFIRKNSTLRELYLLMEFPVLVNPNIKNYSEEMDLTLIEARELTKRPSSLRVLEIQGVRLHAIYPQLDVWRTFLHCQMNLKSLTLRLGLLKRSILECICLRSKTTLQDLYLYKLNETQEDWNITVTLDCSVFSTLDKLKTLYALGCDSIKNANQLPQSLLTVFLTGSIPTVEATHVIIHMPKLKFISFRNACGLSQACGISVDILQRFIEKRRVKRLILNGSSLCEPFPLEGIPNGDPRNPMILKEFDNWDPDQTYLDWELNNDSYYVNKYY